MSKIAVGVLGATGLVGQRLLRRLADHPWFEVTALSGSERSVGRRYGEAVRWRLPGDPPPAIADLVVQPTAPGLDAALLFSALPKAVAREVEPTLAQAGYIVSSNASAFRATDDVPLILPDVNPAHLALVETQRQQRGWQGFIVTNANCVAIPVTLSLKPLYDRFGIDKLFLVSMQAISGAGYPGVASLDIVDNVIPYIGGEEEKIEIEPRKMLGTLGDGQIDHAEFPVSAHANRVASRDGHMVCVSVALKQPATPEEVVAAMRDYRGLPQQLGLPSAAPQPILVRDEPDRPQPIRDRDAAGGMAVTVGRVRDCPLLDIKYVVLGHNTEYGAAGAALLNGELLAAQGYLGASVEELLSG
ncbi:MAG: aspartate-semialdehyde dehydrogenase [Anaerolineales bacterium]|nr:aspartate-semialdehyde dehydrogenase [Anaerolineales bacterium]MCB9126755.1 aspartate-semialdehyde dehydrogenase [Ardenticatenales bacterium]